MLKYIVRRTLLALPTLLVISFLAFGLGRYAPGDPVVNVFGEENYKSLDPAQQASAYRANAAKLGLEGPTFYCSFTTAAYPDTLWRIFPLDRRTRLEKLIGQSGNWPAVDQYDKAISQTAIAIEALPSSLPEAALLRRELTVLLQVDKLDQLDSAIARLSALALKRPEKQDASIKDNAVAPAFKNSTPAFPGLMSALQHLDATKKVLLSARKPAQLRKPVFYWHGTDNQYHRWLSGFVTGNLGLTKRKQKVWDELESGMLSTLTINGLALFLAYLIAVPLGVEMARRKARWQDRWAKRVLLFLYSMPVFWTAGLLIMLFMNIPWLKEAIPSLYFDIQDAWQPGKTSFGDWWSANASKCMLPIIILTLYALALLALQMRSGMLSTLRADYIRTARAKGVSDEDLYWHHALRNALFPIITIFASVLPAVFTGSLVVETLFNFPGVGTKTLEAYMGKDLPLLSAILMVAATLTILGSLLADLLYAWADPRVRFEKENG